MGDVAIREVGLRSVGGADSGGFRALIRFCQNATPIG